ncbi:NeuD/PglB/VioB family sugar acetyltransferase [Epilithonimonas sp.]|uniref:NeuD/PglB/VioB family sugar acetyltransferase n=1 Tax=Epilithonimonas sp. TaxID=2894511 RepID=UPI00289825EF|nr:NeuD/PglB/VioB family sugar acetyltransferase [Epilithonimonas sp.]
MKENCVIVGAGTYGQVYAEYLKDEYNILGFIDDNQTLQNMKINDVKVLGDFDFLLSNIDISTNVFIPIGNNKVRVQLLQRTIEKGFKTPNFIHGTAKIHPSVEIGKGVYILPGTQIMPLTQIKDFVLISMGVNIAHHNIIDQGCFFSQGSNIGANIHFNSNVFCGIASTVMTGVKEVGENSLIGAGAVIIRDVPDFAVVVGNPGKIIKYNNTK